MLRVAQLPPLTASPYAWTPTFHHRPFLTLIRNFHTASEMAKIMKQLSAPHKKGTTTPTTNCPSRPDNIEGHPDWNQNPQALSSDLTRQLTLASRLTG